jgi:hypothetical protein
MTGKGSLNKGNPAKGNVAKAERRVSWALMAFPKKWRRHSGGDLMATVLADLRPGGRTVPLLVLADIVVAGLVQRARGAPAAGRRLLGTYGRFLRLPAVGVVLFLAPRLFYNASLVNLAAVVLGTAVAGCTFINGDQLKSVWGRAHRTARAGGSGHRHSQQPI